MFTMRPEVKLGRSGLIRRTVLLGIGQAAVLAVIGGRLRYLHVTESEKLAGLADRNRISIRLLVPERGLIYDRNGLELAANEKHFKILVIKEETEDVAASLERLSRILPISDSLMSRKLEEIASRREHIPVVIIEEAGWEQVAAVSANAPALPGIQAAVGERRIYPIGADTAHLVGFVGKVNREELSDPSDQDPLLEIPDFQIGKSGAELGLDRELRGRAGNQRIEVNARGRVMRELGNAGARHGEGCQLTIDSWLQNFAVARLGEEAASAVVMNVKNGDILAMASVPAFDPNKFSSGITQAEFSRLLNDKRTPLVNRPVQGIYPPGSTLKMMVALAALEENLVTPDEIIDCRGFVEVSGRAFHCWKGGGHQKVDLRKSLSESCDVYYYTIAQRVGIEKLAATARKFGIGVRPSLPLPGIAQGLLPTKEWKQSRHGKPWLIGDTLNAGIGQGYVLASALQLAVMTSRLASGLMVTPRTVFAIGGRKIPEHRFEPVDVSEAHLELIREAMNAAVNSSRGTAYASRTADESFVIAGKTGTSQVRNISKRERRTGIIKNEDLPLKQRDHALFCCYAPSHDPLYAAAVIVENGGSGSAKAAPIARDLLLRAHYGGIPPLRMYPPEVRDEVRQNFLQLKLHEQAPIQPPASGQRRA